MINKRRVYGYTRACLECGLEIETTRSTAAKYCLKCADKRDAKQRDARMKKAYKLKKQKKQAAKILEGRKYISSIIITNSYPPFMLTQPKKAVKKTSSITSKKEGIKHGL